MDHSSIRNPLLIVFIAFILICTGLATSARAVLISQNDTFSLDWGGSQKNKTDFSSLIFQPFDTTLGTLNSVTFNLQGEFDGSITPQPFFTGPFVTPTGYALTNNFDLRLFGVGSNFGFDSDPLRYAQVDTAPGIATPISVISSFSFDILLNDISELLGSPLMANFNSLSPPTGSYTPPITLDGELGSFESSLITEAFGGIPIELILTRQEISGLTLSAIYTGVLNGSIDLTYDYTPNAAPVPEPATLFLLGFGLAGLAGFSRKRFFKK